MGSGLYGGFGRTSGFIRAVPGSSKLVQKGKGDKLGEYASKARPHSGHTDVIIHGSQKADRTSDLVAVYHKDSWVELDQRRLANFLKHDAGYSGGNIRLISCGTGTGSFAQNLANKLGVDVIAPSDTIWAWPDGKLTIGPTQWKNTGKWIKFKPEKRRK